MAKPNCVICECPIHPEDDRVDRYAYSYHVECLEALVGPIRIPGTDKSYHLYEFPAELEAIQYQLTPSTWETLAVVARELEYVSRVIRELNPYRLRKIPCREKISRLMG